MPTPTAIASVRVSSWETLVLAQDGLVVGRCDRPQPREARSCLVQREIEDGTLEAWYPGDSERIRGRFEIGEDDEVVLDADAAGVTARISSPAPAGVALRVVVPCEHSICAEVQNESGGLVFGAWGSFGWVPIELQIVTGSGETRTLSSRGRCGVGARVVRVAHGESAPVRDANGRTPELPPSARVRLIAYVRGTDALDERVSEEDRVWHVVLEGTTDAFGRFVPLRERP